MYLLVNQAYAGHVITRLVHVHDHDHTGEGRRQARTWYGAAKTATVGGVA